MLEPNDATLSVSLGSAEEILGNFDRAYELYEKALTQSKTINDTSSVLGKFEDYYRRFGKIQKSVDAANQKFEHFASHYPLSVIKQQRLFGLADRLISIDQSDQFFAGIEELKQMFPQSTQIF